MKILIILITLTLNIYANNQQNINVGTKYEAKVYEKGNSLYLKFKGKSRLLYKLEDEPMLYGDKLDYEIEDFNFDGIDDIAVLVGLGYQGVNMIYDVFMANEDYKRAPFSAINYELYPQYNTLLSHYKSGVRHFTELYLPNDKYKLKHFVTYEDYEDNDLCFVDKIASNYTNTHKILSCKALKEQQEVKFKYAKVIVKKALMYNQENDEKSNGMYLIKNDIVELVNGEYGSQRYLVRFHGKRVVTKWVNTDELEVVLSKYYESKHTISHYYDGKNNKIEAKDSLFIEEVGHKKYFMELETIGKNAHMCQLEGLVQEQEKYFLLKGKENCRLKLHKNKDVIYIEDKNHRCKEHFCGMHAYLDGIEFNEVE